MNIPNITEHKAIKLFDEKYGRDKTTVFLKVREEFREMSAAFSEYLATGDDEHLCDEICDLQATVTHLASLFGMYQKQMLHTSVDKVIKRESDPDYKRYQRIGIVFPAGTNRFELEAERLSLLFDKNPKGVIIGVPYSDTINSLEADVSVLEKIHHFAVKNRDLPISLILPKLECIADYVEKEAKPWDRKEINRHSKPSYKNKRRKKS